MRDTCRSRLGGKGNITVITTPNVLDRKYCLDFTSLHLKRWRTRQVSPNSTVPKSVEGVLFLISGTVRLFRR